MKVFLIAGRATFPRGETRTAIDQNEWIVAGMSAMSAPPGVRRASSLGRLGSGR
jgi:hypothetical protein